jgi:hypothetical protein
MSAPPTATLDHLRTLGDSLADAAVTAYFAATQSSGDLFGRLVRHVHLPREDQVPAIRTFLNDAALRPQWVDDAALARGQQFFNRLTPHHFSALYLASLPNSYAAAMGVQVLRMTGRLATDTNRRLNETAQFLMDIAAPKAMHEHGSGVDRILHVRLMHAAVRWMIANDPTVTRVQHLSPPQQDDANLLWSPSWGVPTNQEDLLGTWLTFTVVVYDAFDASGVDYTATDIDDHLHFWRLVAHYLGIDAGLVPTTRAQATVLRDQIFGRLQSPSAAGKVMTAALLAQAHQRVPRVVWPILPAAFRHFLGEHVADMIGVPHAGGARHVFSVLSAVERVITRGADRHPLRARASAFLGRHLMDGLLKEMRTGERPAFAIPTHLAQ